MTPQLLRDFNRLTFAASRRGIVRQKTLDEYRKTINRFEEALGHAAQLSDLALPAYYHFKTWLARHYSDSTAIDDRNRLITLWQEAHSLGEAAECPLHHSLTPSRVWGEEVEHA